MRKQVTLLPRSTRARPEAPPPHCRSPPPPRNALATIIFAEYEAALEPDDGADRADAPEEAIEAETAMETFDSVATELLSIAVAPKRRPGPAQQAAPDAALPPAAVPADAVDADGDVDLVVPAKARPQKRPKKAGAKRAKLQVQRQRAKRVKKKRAVAHAKPRSR